IEGEVIVVAGSACETDGALIAASVVLGKRGKEGKAGPVASVVGKFGDLSCINDRRSFGRYAVRGRCGGLDLDFLVNRTDCKLYIQRASLAHADNYILDDLGLKAVSRSRYGVVSDCQSRKTVISLRVRVLIFADASVNREHLHCGCDNHASCSIADRAFEDGLILLVRGCGRANE